MHIRVRAGLAGGLLALSAGAASGLAGTATAAPAHNRGLTITAKPNPVSAGEGLLIYGRLDGPDNGGQRVVLYHRLAGAPRFTVIGMTRTNGAGFYEFVRPDGIVTTNRQWFVVGPGYTHSRTIQERVSADVSLTAPTQSATTGQTVDFSGSVVPSHPDQRVVLQEQTDSFGNGWKTVAQTTTDAHSDFTFSPSFDSAGDYTLRAALPGDPRNLAGVSPVLNLTVQQTQNASFTIDGSAPVLTDGRPVTITGTLYAAGSTTTTQPGVSVTLYGQAGSGSGGLRAIASTTTDPSGDYTFTQTPAYNMVYVVETAVDSQSTAQLYVGVQDVLTIGSSNLTPELGQAVTISGNVTPQHTGHQIALQELDSGGIWVTVATGKVSGDSGYSFTFTSVRLGSIQLRAQIGGGPASVGADSAPVVLTVSTLAPVATLPAA